MTKCLIRRSITLIELLIVMAIIATISGIVMISVNKALISQRFQTETSMILDKLRLAQDLMLILGTDVHVIFAENIKRDGIDFWLELETKLPLGIEKEVLRKHERLKIIHGVFFHDSLEWESSPGKLDLKFLSNGAVMSSGILKLSTSDDEYATKAVLESFICLPGYPKPIVSRENYEDAANSCKSGDEDYDNKITRDTIQRIPEELKKSEEPVGLKKNQPKSRGS